MKLAVTVTTQALILALSAALAAGCRTSNTTSMPRPNDAPQQILWAWERPEDLTFIEPAKTGVAFLAQTIFLKKDSVRPKPRMQPLKLADDTYLISVTRIETAKGSFVRPTFSAEMLVEVAALITRTREAPNVRAIQIDFDATVSERRFYRQLMEKLRAELPPEMPLAMTALASWCAGDNWIAGFPVDEAVPMVFQMGADAEAIRGFLRTGTDWREPLCRTSYGLSVDEPPVEGLKTGRRTYLFKDSPWRSGDLR